jgi:ubiquinone biosynthesis protein UbiJ
MADWLSEALAGTVEGALNRLLRLDPGSARRLAALEGRLVEIRLRAPALRLCLAGRGSSLQVELEPERAPDAVISGSALALLRSLNGPPGGRPLAGEIDIGGDAEVAGALQALLSELDIDWEEQLSRVVGDVVAHQAGNLVRGLRDWSIDGGRTLERDLADYLREEGRLLADPRAVEAFAAAVDALRADADRLGQRLERAQRLARQGGGTGGAR